MKQVYSYKNYFFDGMYENLNLLTINYIESADSKDVLDLVIESFVEAYEILKNELYWAFDIFIQDSHLHMNLFIYVNKLLLPLFYRYLDVNKKVNDVILSLFYSHYAHFILWITFYKICEYCE